MEEALLFRGRDYTEFVMLITFKISSCAKGLEMNPELDTSPTP